MWKLMLCDHTPSQLPYKRTFDAGALIFRLANHMGHGPLSAWNMLASVIQILLARCTLTLFDAVAS